jgi:Ca2+-binding RTX toxin-like protein
MSLVPWNAAQTVNTSTNAFQTYPTIAQLNDGTMVVTWTDFSSGNQDVKFQRYDALGNKLGVETLAHGASATDQTQSNITALTDGGFVISYVDIQGSTLFGQKFLANGSVNGGAIPLSNPAFADVNSFYPPVVQALAGGGYAVFYTTNNFADGTSGIDLVGRIVDAAGIPGSAFIVGTTFASTQYAPSATLTASGNLMVTWTDSSSSNGLGDIRMQTFSPTGTSLTFDTLVNTATVDSQFVSSITRLSNNRFVVTWSTNNTTGNVGTDIHGQITLSNGSKIGSEFLAGTTQIDEQIFSKVVALADGKFMVVYATDSGSNDDLHAQVFNSNGTTAGPELFLTNTGISNYTVPDVVTLADGRVAVTWADNAADGNATGIRMQILDPREGSYVGTTNADKIWGHDGNVDYITGGGGTDTIYGLRGNDTIYGDAGTDYLYDGRGDDDVYGGADGDYLYGDLGDDRLFGGDGNDTIYSYGGADLMDGGAGTGDSVFYVNERSDVTINLVDQILNAGAAFGDTIVNIERVYGAVYFANNLTGDNNSNILVGGIKNDTLNGGGGFDILRGGLGADTMTGGTSGDYFQYTAVAEGGDTITDWAAGDKFTFARAAFGNLAGANVAAVNFLSVASGHVATTATQKFIFDQATDQLWYDADGSAGGAAVFIADITTNYNILNTDLLLA